MTLFKAVEAAREALKDTIGYIGYKYSESYYPSLSGQCKDALAALPAEPMTEDKVDSIISLARMEYHDSGRRAGLTEHECIIRALKAHGCLYVKED